MDFSHLRASVPCSLFQLDTLPQATDAPQTQHLSVLPPSLPLADSLRAPIQLLGASIFQQMPMHIPFKAAPFPKAAPFSKAVPFPKFAPFSKSAPFSHHHVSPFDPEVYKVYTKINEEYAYKNHQIQDASYISSNYTTQDQLNQFIGRIQHLNSLETASNKEDSLRLNYQRSYAKHLQDLFQTNSPQDVKSAAQQELRQMLKEKNDLRYKRDLMDLVLSHNTSRRISDLPAAIQWIKDALPKKYQESPDFQDFIKKFTPLSDIETEKHLQHEEMDLQASLLEHEGIWRANYRKQAPSDTQFVPETPHADLFEYARQMQLQADQEHQDADFYTESIRYNMSKEDLLDWIARLEDNLHSLQSRFPQNPNIFDADLELQRATRNLQLANDILKLYHDGKDQLEIWDLVGSRMETHIRQARDLDTKANLLRKLTLNNYMKSQDKTSTDAQSLSWVQENLPQILPRQFRTEDVIQDFLQSMQLRTPQPHDMPSLSTTILHKSTEKPPFQD